MSSAIYRIAIGFIVLFLFSAVAIYNVTNAASGTRNLSQSNNAISDSSNRRIREGTTIHDQAGYFRQDGDGATFVTNEELELGGLPNLNLERVVRTLKTVDEPKGIRWSVSGTVTEFLGRNYLLISRAVYKSTPPPPVPEQLSN